MSNNSLTVEIFEDENEYLPSRPSTIIESEDFQQPIQPTPHSLIQEKAAQDFLVTFSEIMNRLATDINPNFQSTSRITPPTWNGHYYSNNTDLIENPTHPVKPKTPCLSKNSEYITNTFNPPIFLLDSITRELVQPNTHRYKEIYLLLQDSHVENQRIFYETHKEHLTDIYKWKKAPIPPVEQLYLLVLVERFDKNQLVDWKLRWYNAFKETMDKEFPICTICGIPKIGSMCREKEWKHPLYVRF